MNDSEIREKLNRYGTDLNGLMRELGPEYDLAYNTASNKLEIWKQFGNSPTAFKAVIAEVPLLIDEIKD